MKWTMLGLMGVGMWAQEASAATLEVAQDGSGQFTTLTGAVNQSQPGDVVKIGPGTYAERVVVPHTLTLQGQSGVVLDGQAGGSVIQVLGGTFTASGLVIQGGQADRGGGILALSADLVLDKVELRFNSAGEGGGLYQSGGSLTATELVVESNVADVGGGIYLHGGLTATVERSQLVHNRGLEGSALRLEAKTAQVKNNLFLENGYDAQGRPQLGAMPAYLVMSDGQATAVINNTFVRSGCCNMALLSRSPMVVRNNLLVGGAGYGLVLAQGSVGASGETLGISYNNFYDNRYGDLLTGTEPAARHCRVPGEDLVGTAGNISVPPAFVRDDPTAAWRENDYHLQSTSLSRDAGGRRSGERDVDGTRNDQGLYGGPASPGAP